MDIYSFINFSPITWISTIVIILLLYQLGISSFSIWESQGVRGPKPLPFLGNIMADFNKVAPLQDIARRKRYGRVYGLFDGKNPSLHISEPELLREVLVKSFNVFTNRRSFNMRNEDPAVKQFLTLMNDEEWKRARNVLTPTFTSGKLKQMVPLIEECIKPMIDYLDEKASSKSSVEIKALLASVGADIISTCAFGIKIDTLNNPDSAFIKHAKNLTTNQNIFIFIILIILPDFMLKMFKNLRAFDNNAVQFFKKVINDVINERKVREIKRPDFLQMLLDAQIPSDESAAEKDEEMKANIKRVLTPDGVVAQSMTFLLGGLDNISTTVGGVCYLLAKHPEIQDRLFQEVKETLAKNDGKLTYDIVFGMDYLDMVVSEGLRMFPAASRTERVAMEDYKLGDILVKKGTTMVVPIYSLHMDEDFFPNPEKFDPERFGPENKSSINQYTYMPFGAGPRNCIGMRFALMETKIILARMVEKFVFFKGPEFEENIQLQTNSFFVIPVNGFKMGVEKRKKKKIFLK